MPITQVGTSPIQIVAVGDEPGIVYNRSTTVTVFWGNNASQANQQNASILDPQASMAVDGTVDVYCATVSGSASVDYVPGATSRIPGNINVQAGSVTVTSGSIAVTSAAPLDVSAATVTIGGNVLNTGQAGFNGLLQQSFNPNAGVTQSSGTLTISQLGYEIIVQSKVSIDTATTPFIKIQIEWLSGVTRMATDTFIVPVSSAASSNAFTVRGSGPAKGTSAIIHITNLDASQPMLCTILFAETSRVYDRDRWAWDNNANKSLTVSGWTLPVLPDDEDILGMESGAAVAAGTSVAWLCGNHNGMVNIGLDEGAGPLTNVVVQIAPEPGSYYVSNNPIYGLVNPPPNFQVAIPRGPFRFQLHNNGTGTVNVTWSAIKARD